MAPTLNLVVPVLSLALLWWLLSDGEPSSWMVGVPAVLLAVWAGRRVGAPSGGVSILGLLRFLPFFIWESIRGGIDVAGRVVGPRLRVTPGLTLYRTRLSGPQARLLFVNSVSLLPGTLAADIEDDRLQIHALDINSSFTRELRRLESVVGRIYGEET